MELEATGSGLFCNVNVLEMEAYHPLVGKEPISASRKSLVAAKMSGAEGAVATETPITVLGESMDLMTALQLVLKKSLAHGGLARGLHEGAKVIEKHAAQLCVLAEDCDQPDYVKLIKALCADHNVNLLTVPSAKTLGEWTGLCKIDSEGKARKVVGCSCIVVKDFGEETEGLNVVKHHIKSY
ncbi:40S ribosomal protein S12 [Dionaea muscipula]